VCWSGITIDENKSFKISRDQKKNKMFSRITFIVLALTAVFAGPVPDGIPAFSPPCVTPSPTPKPTLVPISTTTVSVAPSPTPTLVPVVATTTMSAAPMPTSSCPDPSNYTNDIAILNYALTLEHLEAAFYNQGMSMYTAQNFTDAGFANSSYDYFSIITSHENTHVTVLTSVIQSLNGTAVPPCNYSFGIDSVSKFIAIARVLENTGVRAYDGAIANIQHAKLQTAGATIATIEARHASYLNLLNNKVPFPSVFDTPSNSKTIVSLAGGFITSCPYDLGVVPFPSLVSSPSNGSVGDLLNVSSVKATITDSNFCAFVYSASQDNVAVSNGTCIVPSGVEGDVLVYIVDQNSTLGLTNDQHVVAGPAFFSIN